MSGDKKPTFKDLLEKHHISFSQFYETCIRVPTEDINVLYLYNACFAPNLQRMITHLNLLAQQSYTVEDVYVEQMYGDFEEATNHGAAFRDGFTHPSFFR
jgi:hypothetical protein